MVAGSQMLKHEGTNCSGFLYNLAPPGHHNLKSTWIKSSHCTMSKTHPELIQLVKTTNQQKPWWTTIHSCQHLMFKQTAWRSKAKCHEQQRQSQSAHGNHAWSGSPASDAPQKRVSVPFKSFSDDFSSLEAWPLWKYLEVSWISWSFKFWRNQTGLQAFRRSNQARGCCAAHIHVWVDHHLNCQGCITDITVRNPAQLAPSLSLLPGLNQTCVHMPLLCWE